MLSLSLSLSQSSSSFIIIIIIIIIIWWVFKFMFVLVDVLSYRYWKNILIFLIFGFFNLHEFESDVLVDQIYKQKLLLGLIGAHLRLLYI
jgi:hypothetical protein